MKKKSFKNILNALLLIIITGLVLYFSLKDNFDDIVHQILNLNVIWLLVAILLLFGSYGFRTLSIHHVIVKFKKEYTINRAFQLILVTQFFNAVTPFATGGQPFQVYTLKKDGISITKGTNIIMQNFIVYQVALVLLGLMAIGYNAIFHVLASASLLKYLVTIGFAINTIVVIFLFLIAFAKKLNTYLISFALKVLDKCHLLKDREEALQKWNTYITHFHEGAKELLKDKKMFVKTVLENLAALICLYLVPLAILYGMGNYDMNVITCLVASSYTMLIGAFVPIPGGTGGLEYGYTQFFSNFITGPIVNASMLLWRGITYYLGLIMGALALNIHSKRR